MNSRLVELQAAGSQERLGALGAEMSSPSLLVNSQQVGLEQVGMLERLGTLGTTHRPRVLRVQLLVHVQGAPRGEGPRAL